MATAALHLMTRTPTTMAPTTTATVATDWKTGLPVMRCDGFTLRELKMSDAHSLLSLLTTEEVTRFISPPPSTVEGFERFIQWTEDRKSTRLHSSHLVTSY